MFIAELMRGAGKAWHKTCFTCLECKKRLDSSMLCEREGELYCKGKGMNPVGVVVVVVVAVDVVHQPALNAPTIVCPNFF